MAIIRFIGMRVVWGKSDVSPWSSAMAIHRILSKMVRSTTTLPDANGSEPIKTIQILIEGEVPFSVCMELLVVKPFLNFIDSYRYNKGIF